MRDAPKYKINGRSHRLLIRISDCPRTRRELEELEPNARTARKTFYLLNALLRDGIIYRDLGEYRLTDAGLALLAGLDRQAEMTRPATRRAA